ncbi:class I SAM-dependent methyltransferase [Aestuariivivens sediminis]|uniref:class I SAM-dependent methyltransferase n=1 Tax=Aestuariivivens sediminis TaxID=2913557 RepID=UPI001F597E94|nr:class I SAM-dependent methyltransferase [Aestuariivivens sediminis]
MKSYRLDKAKRIFYKRYKKIKNKITLVLGFNLDAMGRILSTDKATRHSYTKIYADHFKKLKFKKINLLEIGVGGFENPLKGGNSLRLWKAYFPFASIYSIDIYDKKQLEEKRIKIYQGSQIDKDVLLKMAKDIGEIDIIIDDGSHINEHVIKTFNILFPVLKMGGIYVVEDVQTSYWKDYGGDSDNMNNPNTIMNYFKGLCDCLNHKEFICPGYEPSYFDKHIISMHFYHNLIFIYKGLNNEESNMVVNNIR